jgi:hypothetical protein
MAIQLRRGDYEDFDPQKMKPAEVGVVQHNDPNTSDGKAVYVAINPGDVKRLISDLEVEDLVESSMSDALATKVDKVTGMGLSSNNYTNADKEKLAGIATGATRVQFTDSNSDGNIVISFG